MKIAFDAKRAFHNTTGLGNYSRDLIRGIDELKADVEMILLDPKPNSGLRNWLPESCEIISPKGGWRKIHPIWRTKQSGRSAFRNGAELFHGLSNELPTDLHKTKLRSVVTIHDLIFETHPHLFPKTDAVIYRRKFSSAARRADHIVCVSQFTRNLVCDLYGISKSKTSVIYQSCHPSFFKLSPKNENPIGKSYFLMVGRIEERKNHEVALRAMAQFPQQDVDLVIIGSDTSYSPKVKAIITDLGLNDRVHFRHNVSLGELQNYYQNAAGTIYPSHTEGFGIPILESLLSGTPVITNQNGVFSEAGGEEAFYIDVDNPDDLVTQMMRVTHPDFDRDKNVQQAQKRIRDQFSPMGQAQKYVELYRQILS